MMVIARLVTACPVSWDVMLALGMPTHTLQSRKRFTTHVTAVSVNTLAGPVLHPCTVSRCLASLPACVNITEHHQQLRHSCGWRLLLGNIYGVDRAAMLQQRHCCEQEAASMVAAVVVDGRA